MTDPRNKFHDKRVQQEQKNKHKEISPGAAEKVQPGRKPKMKPQVDIATPPLEPNPPENIDKPIE